MVRKRLLTILIICATFLISLGFSAWIIINENTSEMKYNPFHEYASLFSNNQVTVYNGAEQSIKINEGEDISKYKITYYSTSNTNSPAKAIDAGKYIAAIVSTDNPDLKPLYVSMTINPRKVKLENDVYTANYDPNGYSISNLSFNFVDNPNEDETKLYSDTLLNHESTCKPTTADYTISSLSDGKTSYSNITIGNTYQGNIKQATNSKNFIIASSNFIFKYQTVQIESNWYTIEDALETSISGNTIIVMANTAFTNLSTDIVYKETKYREVKSGVTLLLPFEEGDTEGYIHPTWDKGADTSNLPDNTNGKKLYLTLTIPEEITLTNNGTITVGGYTGQRGNNHIGGISGGYSIIKLAGTINSKGTINSYGNIEGTGRIDAISGTILERMEILDWPGGSAAGGRFTAKNGGEYDLGIDELGKLAGGGTITISDPNEFPFEGYQCQAINGPTLKINYGALYTGNVRIFTSQQEADLKLFKVTVPAKLSIANLNIANRDSDSDDALFKLNSDSYLEKKVQNGRDKIIIYNGFVGGKASIDMEVMKAKLHMDTSKVKFPISKQIDLILDGGISSSSYGYEIMSGATITLNNGAQLTLSNEEDGYIFYNGSSILIDSNCTLTISGKFGGNILGKQDAILNFYATNSNSGYIGGTGAKPGTTTFTFSGNVTSLNATGLLYNGEGNFTKNTIYKYQDGKWCSKQDLNITYHANGGNFKDVSTDTLTQSLSAHNNWQGTIESVNSSELLNANDITREHYTFKGWSTSATGNVQDSFDFVVGNSNDLYAIWEPINYSIEYHSIFTGGTEDNRPNVDYSNIDGLDNHTFNNELSTGKVTFNIDSVTKPEGYEFVGIYTNETCEAGTDITELSLSELYGLLDNNKVNIYVQWRDLSVKSFTINYDISVNEEEKYKDGQGLNSELQKLFENNLPSSANVLSTDEYTIWMPNGIEDDTDINNNRSYSHDFGGWYIDGIEERITDYAQIKTNCENWAEDQNGNIVVTLKAKWTPKIHIIATDDDISYSHNQYYHNNETISLSDYNNGNEDYDVSTYFVHWSSVEFGDQITEPTLEYAINDVAIGSTINFKTERYNKAHLIISDSKVGQTDKYIMPGHEANLDDLYPDVKKFDDDIYEPTYFESWMLDDYSGASTLEGSIINISIEEDIDVEIKVKSNRADKLVLTLDPTTSQATLKAKINGQSVPSDEKSTYYVRKGASIELTATEVKGFKDPKIKINGTEQNNNPYTFTIQETTTVGTSASEKTCVIEGTLIMLADGTQKPVEDITAEDSILVFNHETGKYESGKMWYVDEKDLPRSWYDIVYLYFSDGSSIGVSYRHAFFDLDLNKYVYISESNYQEFIGHRYSSVQYINGEFVSTNVTLIQAEVKSEFVKVYGPISEYHFNMVNNGLLSMPSFSGDVDGLMNYFEYGEGMKYDEKLMQEDIEKYGLFTYEDFKDYISEEDFNKTPGKYLKVAIGKGLLTFEEILLSIQYVFENGGFDGNTTQ